MVSDCREHHSRERHAKLLFRVLKIAFVDLRTECILLAAMRVCKSKHTWIVSLQTIFVSREIADTVSSYSLDDYSKLYPSIPMLSTVCKPLQETASLFRRNPLRFRGVHKPRLRLYKAPS